MAALTMDELDLAAEREQIRRETALASLLRAKIQKLDSIGECYNCAEELPAPKLFCNGICAAEYDKAVKSRR